MALLEARKIGKSFGGLQALSDASIAIEPGEIYGLIGPNGAGKTTLFNVLTGLYKPDRGDVLFNGTDLTGRKPNRIAEAGIARRISKAAEMKERRLQPQDLCRVRKVMRRRARRVRPAPRGRPGPVPRRGRTRDFR